MDNTVAIGTAVLVTVISTIIIGVLWICLRRGSKGRAICLLGLSNSGKTLLFMRLSVGTFVRTQTSMKENKVIYQITKENGQPSDVELIDIPGDESLRHRTLKQYLDNLLGVIVLVDSVHFPREVSNLAHLLIDLLSEPRVHKRHVPILIACNKQDLVLARSDEEIMSSLENEITQILTNQSVKLGSLDQSREQQQIQLIAKDETFSFDTPTNSIQFVCCSARGKGDENNCSPDIDNIIKWMNSL